MDNTPVKTLRHHSYAAALRQLTPLVLGPFHCEIWRQGEKVQWRAYYKHTINGSCHYFYFNFIPL